MAISSVSGNNTAANILQLRQTQRAEQPQPVVRTDADGDNDGSRSVDSTRTEAVEAPRAATETLGGRINIRA